MAKRVCCPHCYLVTDVEEDLESYKCPKCEKDVNVIQAERMLELILTRHINDGYKALYESHEYESAIKSYNRYLELDYDNEDIVLYLVIAYLKDNKVRSDHFDDIFKLLDDHEVLLSNFSNNDVKIIDTLLEIIETSEDYLSRLKKALSKNDIFYESRGRDIYLMMVDNINKMFEKFSLYFYQDSPLEDETELTKKEYLEKIEPFREEAKKIYEVMETPIMYLSNSDETKVIDDVLFPSGDAFKSIRKTTNIVNAISVVLLIIGVILILSIKDNPIIGIVVGSPGVLGVIISSIIKAIIRKKSE